MLNDRSGIIMVKDDKKTKSAKKASAEVIKVKEDKAIVAVFSKEQIVSSKKYNQYQDYLMGNLENDKQYSAQQVDDMLTKITKGKV